MDDAEGRDLLTVVEAAHELGLTVRGVQERVRRGLLRGERVSPRLWLIPREEVERAKAQGRLKPGPKPRDQQEDEETTGAKERQ